jgi:hypothetical protein
MNEIETPPRRVGRRGRLFGAAGLLGAGLLTGAIVAGSQVAGAAGSTSNNSTSSSSASTSATHPAGNPAKAAHGPGEKLVTGTNLSAISAAAKAAVPGATIIRVETDSDGGAAYEAHMKKADGTYVTVQFDQNLKVTGTVDGFGSGGPSSGSSA